MAATRQRCRHPRRPQPALPREKSAERAAPPGASERVFAALGGPKELLIVPDAGHNDALKSDVWAKVERWIEALK